MLQSFIIYGFLLLSTSFLGYLSYVRDRSSSKGFWNKEMFLLLMVFTVISAVRYDVGVDHLSYIEHFNNKSLQNIRFGWSLTREPLYYGLVQLLNILDIHFSFLFGIIAFIQVFFIYYTFKNQKNLYPFLGFVFITLNYFSLMNGMRQALVCTIFLFAVQLGYYKRFKHYALLILVSFFIHKSAIILLPLYLVLNKNYDLFSNRLVTLSLLIGVLFIAKYEYWINLIDYASYFTQLFGYETYSNMLETGETLLIEEKTYGARYYIPVVLGLFSVYYSDEIKKSTPYYTHYYNLFIIGILLSTLFYNASLFRRFSMYFVYFNIPVISSMLFYSKLKIKKSMISLSVYFLIGLLCLVYFYAFVQSDYSTYYKFIWES